MAEDLMKLFGALALIATVIFVAPLLGVLFGAFAGWVVGLFYEDTVLGLLSRAGFDTSGLALWQVGAGLGFVGGFFKTTVSKSSG